MSDYYEIQIGDLKDQIKELAYQLESKTKELEAEKAKSRDYKKAIEILRASNAFYADKDNWYDDRIEEDDIDAELEQGVDVNEIWEFYGGKTARQAETEVKELLNEN